MAFSTATLMSMSMSPTHSQSLIFTKFPKINPQITPSLVSVITTQSLGSVVGPQRWTTVRATAAGGSPSTGLYSAQQFELTSQNVDTVLDDVRPYLVADGGNVDVVSVEDGVVSLKLQGACGSCPSSTTTMKMGIERILKEKFGDAVKDIRQVFDEQTTETTVEAVNGHLEILRPAIANFGGSVEVLSVEGGECRVRYTGPDSIGSGITAAIKEKFQDIVNVVLTS